MSELDASIIMPVYKVKPEYLIAAIESILELVRRTGSAELVTLDDCSPDGTAAMMRDRFGGDARVKCVRNDVNSFQAVSRNRGAACAKGEWLLFLDDDNILDSRALVELLACFERHKDAGLVAPLSVHRRPGKENLVWTLGSDFSRWTSRPRDVGANLPFERLPAEPADRPTTYSPNAFMMPRALYEELGGMDERYVQIFEESDFGWRVVESGRTAWIATRARTWHLGFLEPGCVSELRALGIEKPYRTYCFARNRMRFARRHFSFLQALSVALVFAPLSVLYYGCVALKNRRPAIALAYLRGTFVGIFTPGTKH